MRMRSKYYVKPYLGEVGMSLTKGLRPTMAMLSDPWLQSTCISKEDLEKDLDQLLGPPVGSLPSHGREQYIIDALNFKYKCVSGRTVDYCSLDFSSMHCNFAAVTSAIEVCVGTLNDFASTCLCIIKSHRNLES
jgi:hypothetical protein